MKLKTETGKALQEKQLEENIKKLEEKERLPNESAQQYLDRLMNIKTKKK